MICKCESCSAALLFSPKSGMLECNACGTAYWPAQFDDETMAAGDEMEVDVYTCTSCGAELAVNSVETSTFCSYCGQPTVVFDRVSSAKKPKYIIPFSVTKETAVTLIREYIEKGEFVPKGIKDFEVERVRGIYIPFWLYDIEYEDTQFLSGEVGSGKNSHTEYFMRRAETTFYNFSVDASVQLNDGVSQRLEPYNMIGLADFHSAYFSGFYADRFDYEAKDMEGYATYRCRMLFDEEIKKTVSASDVKLEGNKPFSRVINADYAMLPAWFMTFRYQDEPYTILVNGQTAKVVGGVPFDKAAARMRMILLTIIFTILLTPVMWLSMTLGVDDADGYKLMLGILGAAFVSWGSGKAKMKRLQESIKRTKESAMHRFVKDRQEG